MNGKISDLTLNSYAQWQELINSKSWVSNDVYFLPLWYRTWEEGGYGEAHCLHYAADDSEFLYPFLYRRIDGYDIPGTYFDIETAYGLGGSLFSGNPSASSILNFNNTIDLWMNDNHVVAEFIRLHPGLNDTRVRQAEYIPVRNETYLDISGYTEEKIWKEILSDKTRNMIRKGQKQGLTLSYKQNLDDTFSGFMKTYLESFKRLNMQPFYKFSNTYVNSFLSHMKGIASQLDVTRGGELAASSIWLLYGDVLHYYLGATADGFTDLPCSDMYIWEIITRATKMTTIKSIHWGGGRSMDPNDSLYKYKAKYSNRSVTVYIGKRVHNISVYRLLCEQWEKKYPDLVSEHGGKLLKYRETSNG